MDGGIINIVTKLIEDGIVSHSTLLGIIVAMLIWAYFNIARPLQKRMNKVLTIEELNAAFEKFTTREDLNIEELNKKLEQLIELLDEIEDLDKGSYREVKELRRDIEHIKQILNQIQGHLLFGGRRSVDFGNRELK